MSDTVDSKVRKRDKSDEGPEDRKRQKIVKTLSSLHDRRDWNIQHQDSAAEKILQEAQQGVVRRPSNPRTRSGTERRTKESNPEHESEKERANSNAEREVETNADASDGTTGGGKTPRREDPVGATGGEGARNMSEANMSEASASEAEAPPAWMVAFMKQMKEDNARIRNELKHDLQEDRKMSSRQLERLNHNVQKQTERFTKLEQEQMLQRTMLQKCGERQTRQETETRNMAHRMEQMERRLTNNRAEQEVGRYKESYDAAMRSRQVMLKFIIVTPFQNTPANKKEMWQADKKATIDYLLKGMLSLKDHLGDNATKDKIGPSGTLESAIRYCIRLGRGENNKMMKVTFNSQRDRDLILSIYRDQYEDKYRAEIDAYHKERRKAASNGTEPPEEYTLRYIFVMEECHSEEVRGTLNKLRENLRKINEMVDEREEPKFSLDVRGLKIVRYVDQVREKDHKTHWRIVRLLEEYGKCYANKGGYNPTKRKARSPISLAMSTPNREELGTRPKRPRSNPTSPIYLASGFYDRERQNQYPGPSANYPASGAMGYGDDQLTWSQAATATRMRGRDRDSPSYDNGATALDNDMARF